jgi:acyl-CoA thioester hydrolase
MGMPQGPAPAFPGLPGGAGSAALRPMHPANATARGIAVPRPDPFAHVLRFRVRYSETDQMGTFYNSRPLEWFECGRTELFRALGLSYAMLESRGVFLPLVEAHVEYLGRARYDDLLEMTSVVSMPGRARLRCEVRIVQAEGGRGVVQGYTVHACANKDGKATRPPSWLLESLEQAAARVHPGSDERAKGTKT